MPETAVRMVGRRLSGLHRCGAGESNEALPPNGENVLCWYEYFRYGEYNRMYKTFGIGYQFNGNWGGEVAQGQKAKVLAWTPLPKPPKMKRGVKNG